MSKKKSIEDIQSELFKQINEITKSFMEEAKRIVEDVLKAAK